MTKLSTKREDPKTVSIEALQTQETTKKDVSILIRLYYIQKRMNFVKHVTGEWKPVSCTIYNKLMLLEQQIQVNDRTD